VHFTGPSCPGGMLSPIIVVSPALKNQLGETNERTWCGSHWTDDDGGILELMQLIFWNPECTHDSSRRSHPTVDLKSGFSGALSAISSAVRALVHKTACFEVKISPAVVSTPRHVPLASKAILATVAST
jgi:hypothetical protein